ncbi:MAG: hypothetical protein V8S08_11835 [Lachnoclostridium sp.]
MPVLRMITKPLEEITKDARSFVRILKNASSPAKIEMKMSPDRRRFSSAGENPKYGSGNPSREIRVSELETRMRRLPVSHYSETESTIQFCWM